MPKAKKPLTVSFVLNRGWELLKKDFNFWIVIALILFVPTMVISLGILVIFNENINQYVAFGSDNPLPKDLIPIIAGQVIIGLYQIIVYSILITAYLDAAKNKKMGTVKEIFKKGWEKVGRVFITTMILSFIIVLGLILLIIPGIIFALMFGLSVFIVADTKKTIRQAFRLSKDYFSKNFGLLMLTGISIIILLIGIDFVARAITASLDDAALIINSAIGTMYTIYTGLVSAVLYVEIKKRFKPKKN